MSKSRNSELSVVREDSGIAGLAKVDWADFSESLDIIGVGGPKARQILYLKRSEELEG